MLNPTKPERMLDAQGRPYFLWDCDLTLEQFQRGLASSDPEVQEHLLGKLLRQAKPDDVFQFVTLGAIYDAWPRIERRLGRARPMWRWLLETWRRQGRV